MSEQEVTQIRVGDQPVGLLGLKAVLEETTSTLAGMPDDEIKSELVKRISRRNYIPDRARDEYGTALLREFKRCLGQPVEESPSTGLEIKVLGPGCVRCDQLEQEVMFAMSELHLPGNVEHVRDIKEIGKYGVMGTPALVINGKVVSVGKVPTRNKLKDWLKEFQKR